LSDDSKGWPWTAWGAFLAIIVFLVVPLYVIFEHSKFSDDNSRRFSIFLEVASFVLVTPEFLGPERLRSLYKRADQILSGPLASIQKRQKALRDEWDLTIDDLLLPLVTLLFLTLLTLLFAVSYRLWVLWIVPIVWALILVVFSLSSTVKTLFVTIAYLATAGLNRFASWSLGALAERERLRLWIFWFGADCFLISKLLALFEAH
jgi:hypothetical protein